MGQRGGTKKGQGCGEESTKQPEAEDRAQCNSGTNEKRREEEARTRPPARPVCVETPIGPSGDRPAGITIGGATNPSSRDVGSIGLGARRGYELGAEKGACDGGEILLWRSG